MRPIINHFTDNDLYTFTCMYYILQKYPRAETEYCFFDRNRTCYPKGFAQLLCEQLEHLSEVVITDEEREYMTRSFPFLPYWFINVFLRGYRFNLSELTITQDEEGHLDIRVKGKWWSTIMWEMPILATISELMHELNGDTLKYDAEAEYKKIGRFIIFRKCFWSKRLLQHSRKRTKRNILHSPWCKNIPLCLRF